MSVVPAAPGSYILELQLPEPACIQVGRLGEMAFPAGWYYYCGSALAGLRPRVERHWRGGARPHWHIDALRAVAVPTGAFCRAGTDRQECIVASFLVATMVASVPIPMFGSSDCRCPSHLIHSTHKLATLSSEWVWCARPPG